MRIFKHIHQYTENTTHTHTHTHITPCQAKPQRNQYHLPKSHQKSSSRENLYLYMYVYTYVCMHTHITPYQAQPQADPNQNHIRNQAHRRIRPRECHTQLLSHIHTYMQTCIHTIHVIYVYIQTHTHQYTANTTHTHITPYQAQPRTDPNH
jgi:hypothetical protein